MKLPQAQINAGKQALQALWEDRTTVLRTQKTGNVLGEVAVYEAVLCHLSQSSQPMQKQSDTVGVTTSLFKLHVDTNIVILQGDNLQVSHKGQRFKGVAGQPMHYNFSNVIPLEVVEIS